MNSGLSDTLSVVEDLKRRLVEESLAVNDQQEHNMAKILKRLSLLPMSIEILKATCIGKQVNSLRKWRGKVGSRAKSLVKKWKQLIPETDEVQQKPGSCPVVDARLQSCASLREDTEMRSRGGAGVELKERSREKSLGTKSREVSGMELRERSEMEFKGRSGISSREIYTTRTREDAGRRMGSREESRGFPSQHEAGECREENLLSSVRGRTREQHQALLGETSWTPPKQSLEVSGRIPIICIDSGDSDGSIREMTGASSGGHSKDGHHKSKKKKKTSHHHKDEFSRALEMPVNVPRGRPAQQKQHPLCTDSRPHEEDGQTNVLSHTSPGKLENDRAAPTLGSGSAGRKRQAEPLEEVGIGHSKRSRTQVYSGKKVQTGPQVVASLFDLCMKILIDNIDVIEEVGPGVPYHVLEPLLLRCSATQLMKLEEFNPHLVEDTDGLWQKLVCKEFKLTKLISGESWRELYAEKLAEKEEKLRSLTARIKANNHAREEPVRKVMMADATRKPGRRSGIRRGGGFSRPMERPHPGTQLMKRTMKMAKERNHIMTFKK